MVHVATVWFVIAALAAPQEPAENPDGVETTATNDDASGAASDTPRPDSVSQDSFGGVLQVAKQRYFAGELPYARELLSGLQSRLELGETPPLKIAIEAMTYLGEVLYKLGDREGAESAFRFIFERNPDAPISPYHHPIEVVALFDVVRAEVKAERQAAQIEERNLEPPEIGRAPLWTYAPFGIAQFRQRRPATGLVFGGLQVGLGVASLLLLRDVHSINEPPANPNDDAAFDEVTRRGLQRKFLVQWPVTIAFYGVWGASIADAQRSWRRNQLEAVVGVGPVSERTQGLMLHARF